MWTYTTERGAGGGLDLGRCEKCSVDPRNAEKEQDLNLMIGQEEIEATKDITTTRIERGDWRFDHFPDLY